MNSELLELSGLSRAYLEQGFYVLLRVGPIIGFVPGFGERTVPVQVKLVLALCLTVAVLPILGSTEFAAARESGFIAILATETSKGLFLGLSLRFFVIVLQVAGSMAAQATSLAQLFAGSAAEPMPAIGHLLVIGGLALAMVMQLPLRVIEFTVISYEIFPLSSGVNLGLFAEWAGKLVSHCFALAFSLAAPFLIMSLLYNLTLGVINRAMPQLMVAFVGAPVITAGGLLFMFLFSGLALSAWWQAFEQFLTRPEAFVR